MPLTKEQLLIPRYKIIDKYPGMELEPFHLGQIITLTWHEEDGWIHVPLKHIPGSYMRQAFFDEFPNIFESLHWWSDRKPEDMEGLYIKCEKTGCYKIVTHFVSDEDKKHPRPYFYDGVDDLGYYYWQMKPEIITEAEYTAYINQKQQ